MNISRTVGFYFYRTFSESMDNTSTRYNLNPSQNLPNIFLQFSKSFMKCLLSRQEDGRAVGEWWWGIRIIKYQSGLDGSLALESAGDEGGQSALGLAIGPTHPLDYVLLLFGTMLREQFLWLTCFHPASFQPLQDALRFFSPIWFHPLLMQRETSGQGCESCG